MYHVRIPLGIALLAAIAGLLWLDLRVVSGAVLVTTLSLVAMQALRELYTVAGVSSRFLARIGTLGGAALLVGPWLDGAYPGALGVVRATELVPAALIALVTGWALVRGQEPPPTGGRPTPHTLSDLSWTAAGLAYVVYPLSSLVATKGLPARVGCGGDDPARAGIALVLYLIVVAKSADIGGYLVGKPFGRHKLIPRISPNKSWEGAIGGLALSVAVAVGLAGQLGACALTPFHAAVFGAAMAPLSLAGDLLESYLKRWSGVKDSGNLVPTYGGMLDMVDSLTLCAPVGHLLLLAFVRGSAVT